MYRLKGSAETRRSLREGLSVEGICCCRSLLRPTWRTRERAGLDLSLLFFLWTRRMAGCRQTRSKKRSSRRAPPRAVIEKWKGGQFRVGKGGPIAGRSASELILARWAAIRRLVEAGWQPGRPLHHQSAPTPTYALRVRPRRYGRKVIKNICITADPLETDPWIRLFNGLTYIIGVTGCLYLAGSGEVYASSTDPK